MESCTIRSNSASNFKSRGAGRRIEDENQVSLSELLSLAGDICQGDGESLQCGPVPLALMASLQITSTSCEL